MVSFCILSIGPTQEPDIEAIALLDLQSEATYFSVKVRLSSQATMGRFLRSLYVGRITEYLSPLGAIVSKR